jgi:hypothetical protein
MLDESSGATNAPKSTEIDRSFTFEPCLHGRSIPMDGGFGHFALKHAINEDETSNRQQDAIGTQPAALDIPGTGREREPLFASGGRRRSARRQTVSDAFAHAHII